MLHAQCVCLFLIFVVCVKQLFVVGFEYLQQNNADIALSHLYYELRQIWQELVNLKVHSYLKLKLGDQFLLGPKVLIFQNVVSQLFVQGILTFFEEDQDICF